MNADCVNDKEGAHYMPCSEEGALSKGDQLGLPRVGRTCWNACCVAVPPGLASPLAILMYDASSHAPS